MARVLSLSLAILCASACGGGGGDDTDAGLTPGEPTALAGITTLHNMVRAQVGVPPLTWDPALAQIAQSWADQCIDVEAPPGLIDHDANRSATYPEYVGENIYGTTGTATASQAVTKWASEASSYDYANNTCSSVCGHYTQLVWKTTTKVGCGISLCPQLLYQSSIVCDYAPGGNDGNRPY